MIKSYGIPGESQETRTELDQSAPYVLMSGDRPEPHYICEVVDGEGMWVEPPETRDYKHFTGQAKLDLFTEEEQSAILGAAYAGNINVIMVYERFKIADYLTYSDPRMEAGLAVLVEQGMLTPERKDEVVTFMTAERQ